MQYSLSGCRRYCTSSFKLQLRTMLEVQWTVITFVVLRTLVQHPQRTSFVSPLFPHFRKSLICRLPCLASPLDQHTRVSNSFPIHLVCVVSSPASLDQAHPRLKKVIETISASRMIRGVQHKCAIAPAVELHLALLGVLACLSSVIDMGK
jgi:hypothetical protein